MTPISKPVKRSLKFPHCPEPSALAAMTVRELTSIQADGFSFAHYAARMGHLGAIPESTLAQVLDVRAVNGDTPLCLAAANRRLKDIPPAHLTEARLSERDADGVPLVHLVARGNMFHCIAEDQITPELVGLTTSDGDNLLHAAASNGLLHCFAEYLTPESCLLENGKGDTPLHLHFATAWRGGGSFPEGILTEASILAKNGSGVTVVEAGVHNIDKFPEQLLTLNVLLQADSYGNTVLHRVAKMGYAAKLPRHALDMDASRIFNRYGDTPLHCFYSGNSQDSDPPAGWATDAGFAALNYERETPFHIAVQHGVADRIPERFLTPRALTQKNRSGWSPLQEVAHAAQCDRHGGEQIHSLPEASLLSLPVFLERCKYSQQTVVSQLLRHGYVAGLMEVLLRHGFDAASYDEYIRAGHAPNWPELRLSVPVGDPARKAPNDEDVSLSQQFPSPCLSEITAPRCSPDKPVECEVPA